MSDPDPCCVHETQLDAAIRDLARAHGRPVGAERVARGLPPMTNKARHEHVAGLTFTQEEPLDVEDLTPHLKQLADYAARFAHGYQEDT